ncbi:MAG: hypothetical protein JW832_10750 [Deltaproteobacteria bacterium]|nr:hypothetical protein [Deltaproteobacteria bacterium]
MRKLFLLLCLACLTGGCIKNTRTEAASAPVALDDAVRDIAAAFADIESDIGQAAADCAAAGGDRKAIREALGRLHAEHTAAADVAFIDTRGIMQVIEPAAYKKFQGADVSGNAHNKKMLAEQKPLMSESFKALEGFSAVAIQYPVIDSGAFSGSVSMLLRPESLLKALVEPRLKGVPVDIWAMEPAGRIIYDPDAEEIGRNIFSDPLYAPFPGLIEAARLIAGTAQGMATYYFLGRGMTASVKKYAYWQTVAVYGRPWRIVLTKAEKEGVNGKKTLEELGLKSLNEAFREFVALDEMQEAIARKDRKYLMALFQEFYENNPGLYSVQWVDEKCITRFGYPPENSLKNYRFDATRDAAQSGFITAVKKGRESFLEEPLMEGNIGQMLLCPVTPKGKYRGMVYYVRIKP